MKILDGRELAGFIKERQAHQIRSLYTRPKLLIIRDSDNPVITKYVNLKIKYGQDIGAVVEVFRADTGQSSASASSTDNHPHDAISATIADKIKTANSDPSTHGIIIQLPLTDKDNTEDLCNLIAPEKDVDGLGAHAKFDSATATAINWLLAGYDINLHHKKIALVGRGKLVGAPLYHMFTTSGYDVQLFHRGSDLTELKQYDIIITATGVPGLITSSMISPGAVVVDAGTASENGILKGDLAPDVRQRRDLAAITPTTGGVGPLTVTCFFDHLIQAANDQ